MEPSATIPDVQLFIVLKWAFIGIVASGLMTLGSLIVKKWWYGNEKRDRRASDREEEETRMTLLDHFLENQKQQTIATQNLTRELHEIQSALAQNGDFLKAIGDKFHCKYQEHAGRR